MYVLSDIIEKARAVHGDKYDYSRAVYKRLIDKMEIICPEHGSFLQAPHQHLKGQGCPICARIKITDSKRDNKESFIEKAIEIHGDKYDYSNVNYINSNEKVEIICKKHGSFLQRPYAHLLGNGCPECKKESISKNELLTNEDFIKKAREVHGDKYDYSMVDYTLGKNKVKIICPKHGLFEQIASSHLMGHGCPMCADENRKKKTNEDFIKKARKVHGDEYDYTKTEYKGVNVPVIITCKKHGDFMQMPSYHLDGCGCSKCNSNSSKGEEEIIEYIHSIGKNIEIEIKNRSILSNGNELDIFIPSKNIAIEYDGLYWHSEANGKDKKYHLSKTDECEKKGIQLIHVFEDEWLHKKEICKSRIKNLLGYIDQTIYARKCIIKNVDTKEERDFLNKNHIQGYVPSKFAYGLYYNDELVSLMTFTSLRKNLGSKNINGTFELLRFCNKIDYRVIGGASRLFKHFIREIDPDKIISYADRRWSVGKLYESIGFYKDHVSEPSYYYIIGDERKNRFGYRKDILISKYRCTPEETEHSFCLKNKWYRIYDCGTIAYEWKKGEN